MLLNIAPMMDWTDRHCRFLHRLFSPHIRLYTEMITAMALFHGDPDRLLYHDSCEAPLVLQVGGRDPKLMAHSARLAQQYGFDEININVGCPSGRVQSGQFGACLMAEPEVVATCVRAMRQETDLPISIKTRIGIDDQDSYAFLQEFVSIVHAAGTSIFVIHARKACLAMDPKQNRTIPPLCYEHVMQLKQDFPDLCVILNGGLQTVSQVQTQLTWADGVMLGREAYHNSYILAELAAVLWGQALPSREEILEHYTSYMEGQLAQGIARTLLIRPLLGLFHGMPNAREWRRRLIEKS